MRTSSKDCAPSSQRPQLQHQRRGTGTLRSRGSPGQPSQPEQLLSARRSSEPSPAQLLMDRPGCSRDPGRLGQMSVVEKKETKREKETNDPKEATKKTTIDLQG